MQKEIILSIWSDICAYGFEYVSLCEQLLDKIRLIWDGKTSADKSNGSREIAVFKDGVTL